MEEKRKRKTGAGRKKKKPEFDRKGNLQEQMQKTVWLYYSGKSLQMIADGLNLNPIKLRICHMRKVCIFRKKRMQRRLVWEQSASAGIGY